MEGTIIHPFPVFAVVHSWTIPTQLAYIKDVQMATQDLQTFQDVGLFWKAAKAFGKGRVFTLASHLHAPSTDCLVLPHLSQEEFITQQQIDVVPAIKVKYNREDHMWIHLNGRSMWYMQMLIKKVELMASQGAEL